MPLGTGGHGGGALAGGKADHPAFWRGGKMAAQHDIGMGGGHRRIENRTQKRASVGHRSHGSGRLGEGRPLSLLSAQKKTPAGRGPRGSWFSYRPIEFVN